MRKTRPNRMDSFGRAEKIKTEKIKPDKRTTRGRIDIKFRWKVFVRDLIIFANP